MPLSHDEKIGRNDPCHCGSGRKYKKCCIDVSVSVPFQPEEQDDDFPADPKKEALVHTVTGELFMPARLYYRVYDRRKLTDALLALKCLERVNYDTFNLSYWHEAEKVHLARRYNQVPEDIFPILLAACGLRGDNEMTVDVRSFERAWRLILFFDRHISRKFARVTHIATYNRLVRRNPSDEMAQDLLSWDYDTLFSEDTMQIVDHSKDFSDDDKMPFSEEESKILEDDFAETLSEPIPKTIKMPLYFYEEGIRDIESYLTARMFLVGIASREGEFATMGQVMERFAVKMPPEPVD